MSCASLLYIRRLSGAPVPYARRGLRTGCGLTQVKVRAKCFGAALELFESHRATDMENYTAEFSLDVEGIKGYCPAGEVYSKQQIANRSIPVLSCEGPCIRGEIARLAANLVVKGSPLLARACHAETFLVPHSSMAAWVKRAEKSIMIDGCFLKCHGRVLRKLVGPEKVVQIDALPLYKRYSDIFLMDDVPEQERKEVALQVADKIIAKLKQDRVIGPTAL